MLYKNLLIIPLSVDTRLNFYNPFTITIITLKFVSQRKIITSVNHLITRGPCHRLLYLHVRLMSYILSQENCFPSCVSKCLSDFTRKERCSSEIENMKYSNQIALLWRTKNHLRCCFVFLVVIH